MSLGEHRSTIIQLSASMTSKGRNNVYPASFQTYSQLVAHGPDRAPAGAPLILFAALSGGGPDIASKLAGRFNGQQRVLASSRCGVPPVRPLLPKSTFVSPRRWRY